MLSIHDSIRLFTPIHCLPDVIWTCLTEISCAFVFQLLFFFHVLSNVINLLVCFLCFVFKFLCTQHCLQPEFTQGDTKAETCLVCCPCFEMLMTMKLIASHPLPVLANKGVLEQDGVINKCLGCCWRSDLVLWTHQQRNKKNKHPHGDSLYAIFFSHLKA